MLVPFANVRPDGSLALLVVNKSPTRSYNATIGLAAFAPNATAQGWRMDEATYQWSTASTPYHASPNTGPASFALAAVSTRFAQCFPPYSLTVLQMTPAVQP
jgi:alpha-L-arabinofuranosidase